MPNYVGAGVENEVTWNKLDRTDEDFENKQHADILHDGNLNNFLSKSEDRLKKHSLRMLHILIHIIHKV